MKTKLIQFNPANCAGCRCCEMVCSLRHEQVCGTAKSRIRIVKDFEYGNNLVLLCQQCADAYCLNTCPRDSLHRDEKTGAVLSDPDICRGCGACIASCSISGIRLPVREAPPCELACPLHMDIQGYVGLITKGKVSEAYQLIRKTNPLPAVCGRVCQSPCEDACKRQYVDEPVAIRALKRFITDNVDSHKFALPRPAQNGTKVAIIGSGPAGLGAAHDLALMGYAVTVFEARPEPGGMMRYAIPAYRLPLPVVKKQINDILDLGIELKAGQKLGGNLTLDQLKSGGFAAVFLAVGAPLSRKIELPGAKLRGVLWGLDFLASISQKKRIVVKKRVLVIGGGNVAIDVALTALRKGAGDVTLACLESRGEMPAHPWEIQQAEAEGIKIMTSWGPSRILGATGKVSGVELVRCSSVFDSQGNFCPAYDSQTMKTVEADQVILAIGQATDLAFVGAEMPLKVARGLVVVDPDRRTSVPGVFAGGDLTGQTSVVGAIAAGRQAARSIDSWLKGIPVFCQVTDKPAKLSDDDRRKLQKEWETQARFQPPKIPASLSIKDFSEVEQCYASEQAQNEALRCACQSGTILKCDLCGGDPECVQFCSREALTIKEIDLESPERKACMEDTARALAVLRTAKAIIP